MKLKLLISYLPIYFLFPLFVYSQNDERSAALPDAHAPIGVMGDHLHQKGEWMLSYRYMRMQMQGNRLDSDGVSPVEIATQVENIFFGSPMQPPTLRVVPTEMPMDMHMLGLMYAPNNWLTLMAMTMIVRKEMSHITFQGGMGTNQLGTFVTQSNGFGDTRLSALVKLFKKGKHRLHLNAGISIPTGSITQEDQVLTPLDAQPVLRLPYPMQLGSGTFDLLPGITYSGNARRFAWGGQLSGLVRLGENDAAYTFGDQFNWTTWGSYRWANWMSSSIRISGYHTGKIDGLDLRIVAPVQTANPDFQGGRRFDLSWGINLIGTRGIIQNQRIAFEFDLPVFQHLHGPQLEVDYRLTLGWQYAF